MTPIDRDKLRTAMRKMGEEYIYYMLYDAIGLLPETKLRELCEEYYTAAQIAQLERSDDDPIDLLSEVRRFEKASLAKEYYESFDVNSKNSMDTSKGTCAWFADCRRLLRRCAEEASFAEPESVLEAFEALFRLLDRIDGGYHEMIFFADEGGSWQLGVDWSEILPAWFTCLSAGATAEDFAVRVVEIVDKHECYRREAHLKAARDIATPAQQKALRVIQKR